MSSGCVRLVNLLNEQLRKFESKLAERHTNENSFKHLSSQSDRLAAVICNPIKMTVLHESAS